MKPRAARCRPWPSPITEIFLRRNRFYHAAKTRGVKPIIGCEVYVAKGSRHDRGETPQRDAANGHANPAASEPGQRGSNHLVLLCENPKATAT